MKTGITATVRVRALLLVATAVIGNVAHGSDDFGPLERHAAKEIDGGTVPSLALAVARDGKIVYERAFGYADMQQRLAATTHTAYPLASASKPITATALMALSERGGVDLDAPVESYIAPLRFRAAEGHGHAVTLQHLLSHTSGLGTYARIAYGDDISSAPSLEQSFRSYGVLVHPAGRVSEYSNLGYGLISRVIARRSGRTFGEFVEQAVLQPLGMRDSFVDSPGGRTIDVAKRYDAAMRLLPELYNDTPGAGNIYASVHDLILFGMFHLHPDGQSVIGRKNVERMRANADARTFQHYYANAYYGLGWNVRNDDHGFNVAWHEGGMPGASAIIKLIPERHIAVAVLANRTDANDLTQNLADELLEVVLPEYKPAPLNPTANYSAYVAQPEYLGKWSGTIRVDGDDLRCALIFEPGGKIRIRYAKSAKADAIDETRLGGMIYGDSFIGAFEGRLPAHDIDAKENPLLLLKLIRSGNTLSGAVVAYSSPERLNYLLPFYIRLQRDVAAR